VVCAHAFGARAIAVATGRHSVDQLQVENPDAVFSNLDDTTAFWRVVDAV
jgi:phosphoglycolate phosphatase-like HAD superfamily hydrolase